ncbi:MAG: DEAD/DEAH box helicase [Desulfotomaculales bacterium]
MLDAFLREFWAANGWQLVHTFTRPGRSQRLFDAGELDLSVPSRRYLGACYPDGLYLHQLEAIRHHLQGRDVGLTTGTASGKSLPFYVAAIEALVRDPGARVLAIYPLKALAREQERRWADALATAGFPRQGVARLDGDVPVSRRAGLLQKAAVVVATPDIVHAWLLPGVGEGAVWRFIAQLGVVVVDEVHVYTGVFGSNAAFLFRRLEHLMALAGQRAAYVAASATIRDAAGHLRALCGRDFHIVDESHDTSGQQELNVYLVNPPDSRDILTSVSGFLQAMASRTPARFITFVDSRKQTELMATIIARSQQRAAEAGGEEPLPGFEHLQKLDVLPYRAGFEEHDRAVIQDRLASGTLRGVVATSALELGIDIPHLDAGVLVGVPRSGTSLMQRIGRVGRKVPGAVVVVNNGDVYSEAMFRKPAELFERPLAEGALYLENPRIQYIHAMCLARPGGEHDRALARAGASPEGPFSSPVSWPPGFVELCARERAGEIPPDLQSMKMEAGDTPHHTYPLRDVESQFNVEHQHGPEVYGLGSLSFGQVLREAYPGAVYYYTTVPYRVYQVLVRARTVRVRRERYYTTRPQMLPTQVFPNLSPGNVHRATRQGELFLVETNLQIREAVCGYKERRGPTEISEKYPLEPAGTGISYPQELFTRNYFTTGVIVVHPALLRGGVAHSRLAELLYECFLIEIPFERQDINWAAGRLKVARGPFQEGTVFITIFDQTYGSLRLSGRLMDSGVMRKVLLRAIDVSRAGTLMDLNDETMGCLNEMLLATALPVRDIMGEMAGSEEVTVRGADGAEDRLVRIILPGSVGLDRMKDHEEFYVAGVFFSPRDGLRYRGRHPSDTDATVRITVPVQNLVPVPGESRLGWYDLETGEIVGEEGQPAEMGDEDGAA